MKFEIGDRVEVIARQQDFNTVGLLGTVRLIGDDVCNPSVGVEHDCKLRHGHTLGGLCSDCYGRWYYDAENQLMVITDDETAVLCDGLEDVL